MTPILRRLAVPSCLIAVALACPLSAGAATSKPKKTTSMRKAIWGPVTLPNGKSAFPTYRKLGVGIFETQIFWSDVAATQPADASNPNDPAYKWPAEVDAAVKQAKKYGIQVLIRVARTPGWANGGQASNFVPNDPNDLATFMAAASKRYGYAKYWDVWEETTRAAAFSPLTPQTNPAAPLTAAQAVAPQTYAKMLDASYGALKKVSSSDIVLGGNTFVAGDITPRNFIKNLRLPDGKPPRMDMYAHNPFSGRKPDIKKPPLANGYADISDADTLAKWIDDNLQRGKKKIPLFFTEFTLPTDHVNHDFNFYVSKKTQAEYLTAALKLARGYSRVKALGWFTLLDESPNAKGDESNFGLMTYKGKIKPSFSAFARG